MRYLLLIYAKENGYPQPGTQEFDALLTAYNAFGEQYKDRILASEALMPTQTATTLRVRDGKSLTTDGPFAETKEQLGGFYLVKVDNLDEAISIAAHIPDAANGSIEVRPIMEFS